MWVSSWCFYCRVRTSFSRKSFSIMRNLWSSDIFSFPRIAVCCFIWLTPPGPVRVASLSALIFASSWLTYANSLSKYSMEAFFCWFYFRTYYSFSRVWETIITAVRIFQESLESSSLRSSIFSLRVWFSILSCSKSIKWSPSASCSFFLRTFSQLAS